MAGRSRHRVSIFNQNPRLTLRWRHFTSFFGQIFLFRAIEGDDGRATLGRKRNPMCFQPTKGRSTRAKREQNARNMRATREKHASDTRETCEYFRPPITQHRHLSLVMGNALCQEFIPTGVAAPSRREKLTVKRRCSVSLTPLASVA